MAFNFEQCRSLLLDATLAELEADKASILKIPGLGADGVGFRHVSAICLEISPWHRDFDMGFRDDDEKWDERIRNSIGDWKLYPLWRGVDNPQSTPQRVAVIEYFEREYGAVEDSTVAREIAHLMLLAAAEALLDHSVTTLLRQYQIDAPYVDDTFLPHRCFEYIVTDSDNSISANYCEIVIANRITQRLKLRLEQATD